MTRLSSTKAQSKAESRKGRKVCRLHEFEVT